MRKLLIVKPTKSDIDCSSLSVKGGFEVRCFEIPGSPAFWTLETLREKLKGIKGYDVILLPGNVQEDLSALSKELGVKVVKGPISPILLEKALRLVDPIELSEKDPFEKAFPEMTSKININILGEIIKNPPRGTAFELRSLKLPLRPPPQLVFSEVYICNKSEIEEIDRRLLEGADLIVVGRDARCDKSSYIRSLKVILDRIKVPVGADPGFFTSYKEVLDTDIDLFMSVTLNDLERIPVKHRKNKAFVLIPSTLNPVEELRKAAEKARSLGFEKVILDPIAGPPLNPGTLQSLINVKDLAESVSFPILFGLCNVIELMDGDSTGATLLATALAFEAGASAILVVEKSAKTLWNTMEAKIASNMISIAWKSKTFLKDLYPFSLLSFKAKKFSMKDRVSGSLLKVFTGCNVNMLKTFIKEIMNYSNEREFLSSLREILTLCLPLLLGQTSNVQPSKSC